MESVVLFLATFALKVVVREVIVVRTQTLHFDHYSALVVVGCTHNQSCWRMAVVVVLMVSVLSLLVVVYAERQHFPVVEHLSCV